MKNQTDRQKLIEKCNRLAWENLEQMIINNHKLEQINKDLENMNQEMKSMVGDVN